MALLPSLGKTIITGASSGVGKALAIRLASKSGGANTFGLHICGRDAGRLEDVQKVAKMI